MELKPCPFCGGEADIECSGIMWSNWRIGCRTMGCAGWIANLDGFVTEFAAAEAWNTRAERTGRIKEDETDFLVCSECGAIQPEEWTVYYCWSCGAKVVEA